MGFTETVLHTNEASYKLIATQSILIDYPLNGLTIKIESPVIRTLLNFIFSTDNRIIGAKSDMDIEANVATIKLVNFFHQGWVESYSEIETVSKEKIKVKYRVTGEQHDASHLFTCSIWHKQH